MSRLHFFGPGQAALPEEVLREAAEAVIEYRGSGLSILELPHRGRFFDAILEESRELVRRLCGLGDDFEILWLPGGGRLQFAMVPMNFLQPTDTAGFFDTGAWAHEAMEYAAYYGRTQVLSSSREDGYKYIPELPEAFPGDLKYAHLTTNNTIYGTQWDRLPEAGIPLVADMSSDILSRSIDYRACSLFYAVAQKNMGPAGATLVCIRKDALKQLRQDLAPMMSYAAHVERHSVLNTPPVFAVYATLLMLRWTDKKGVPFLEEESRYKSELLYTEIERNPLFHCDVREDSRSRMNVVFRAADAATEKAFLAYARERNIEGLEGHRSAGAFRASLYNGVRRESAEYLVQTMQAFEKEFRQ